MLRRLIAEALGTALLPATVVPLNALEFSRGFYLISSF